MSRIFVGDTQLEAMNAARVRAGLKPIDNRPERRTPKVTRGQRQREAACAELFPVQVRQVPPGERPGDVTGWVYFAGAHDRGKLVFIKIGYTAAKNPNRRLEGIAQGSAHEVKLLCAVRGCRALELTYLVEFRRTHVKGEWFEPSPDLMARIESLNARLDSW
jgi:hypothetical protein